MLICSFTAIAQQNQIRINALSLVGGKLSIEYERLLTPKIAFGAAFSVRPANALPFRSKISDIIDDTWDMYEKLIAAEESYIEADVEAQKAIDGVDRKF